MARTPLADAVQDAVAAAAAENRRTTRTQFVKQAGAAAVGLAAFGRFAAPARGAAAPKIVVVGAGLAGLNAAYSLKNAGYSAEIHEAPTGSAAAAGRSAARSRTDRSQSTAAS